MGGCNRAVFPGAVANLLFLFLIVFVVAATIIPITVFAEPITPANNIKVNETELYSNATGETPTTKR